jgi:hypothetical protein
LAWIFTRSSFAWGIVLITVQATFSSEFRGVTGSRKSQKSDQSQRAGETGQLHNPPQDKQQQLQV